jgi:hypothetical protein
MSGCGCGTPGGPSSSGGAGMPATGPTGPCAHAQSSILIVDELGLPLASTSVQVTAGAATAGMTTDPNGFLCFSAPPGTAVRIEIADAHQMASGDSSTTSSGHHFLANGTGP